MRGVRVTGVFRERSYIPEAVVGLAALVAFNALVLPHRPAFEGVDPNPFWIVVVAIAARYARSGALFAGVLTSAVFLGYLIASGGIDALYDDLWLLRFPFLFVLVGFLLGEVRTAFLLREEYLTSRLREVERLNEKLTNESDVVKEAHRELTSLVAHRQDTIVTLHEITERFKSPEPDAIFHGILEGFHRDLGAEECSLYIAEGTRLRLAQSFGWKDYHHRPASYPVGQGLVGVAAQTRQLLSVKDFVLRRHAPGGEPPDVMGDSLLAVPIVGLEDRLYGVASIEKLSLLKMTESTIQTARVICDLAASALNCAFISQRAEAQQVGDDRLGLFPYSHFLARLDEEGQRAAVYGSPFAAMAFRWPGLRGGGDERTVSLAASAIAVVKARLKPLDVLAHGPDDETPLVLLLVAADAAAGEAARRDIIARLKEYGLDRKIADRPIEDTIAVAASSPAAPEDGEACLKALGL